MFNISYTIISISICLWLGNQANHILGGLPSSLYGMLILTAMLSLKLLNPKRLASTVSWAIANMGVCFVPAGVGIMQYYGLLARYGLAMTLIIVLSTLLMIIITGALYQYLLTGKKQ